MTGLTMLRDEIKNHSADSSVGKLLAWAEIHIGDQFDRICELEDETKELAAENEKLRMALSCVGELMNEVGKFIQSENFEISPDTFARDFAPWRNIMAANGMKQDGTEIKKRTKKAK